MRYLALTFFMRIAGGMALGDETTGTPELHLAVCANVGGMKSSDLNQISVAAKEASKVFATVGVTINWHISHACKSWPEEIEMNFKLETPEQLRPKALAYAFPFQKRHIVILYDRIEAEAANKNVMVHLLLSYVLLHEITHVLQEVDTHAPAGIMKAKWSSAEHFQMRSRKLVFTAHDVLLIHAVKNATILSQLLASK